MKAAPLGLRLFLEGIEVPVISAQVSIAPDRPVTADIQVIPSNMGLHLLPRTLVHLFYLDNQLSDEEIEQARVQARYSGRPGQPMEDNSANTFDVADISYKLLFTGEVIGLQYAKTPASRQLVLQCMDLSSYWDTCYQWFAEYAAGGNALTDITHQFVGAGEGLFDDVASGTQWMISRILKTKPQTPEYKDAVGLLGGLIHLLEAVGGIRYRSETFKGFGGVNDFFSIAELRYNLLGMLGAIEADKTSSKIYGRHAFWEWLRNGMTSLGNLISFRDILRHINRYIFHNIYPNPCAFYVPPSEGIETKTKIRKVPTRIYSETLDGEGIRVKLKQMHSLLMRARENYQGAAAYELPEPGKPTMERPEVGYMIAQDQLYDAQSKLKFIQGLVEGLDSDDKADVEQQLRKVESDIKAALSISLERTPAGTTHERPNRNTLVVSEVLLEPGESVASTQTQRIKNFVNRAKAIVEELDDGLSVLNDLISIKHKTKNKKVTKNVKVNIGSHLYNQLFLPEVFFVSPPRCNVIFPDQYFNFQWSRNFMRETTRLMCQGGLGVLSGGNRGMERILGRQYFAPNIKDVRGKLLRATKEKGARVLLPHETHSGIIPKLEWVTDGHRWGVKASKEVGQEGKLQQDQKVSYIQRLAHFQFYLHRWSSRTMGLQGIFMPQLVLGFPGVVIDRPAPSPEVLGALAQSLGGGRINLPMQFLGKIVGITHSLSQQGGQTSVNYSYCRVHRGLDDEYLGTLSKEIIEEGPPQTIKINTKNLAKRGLSGDDKVLRGLRMRLFELWAQKRLKKNTKFQGIGTIKSVTESGAKAKIDKAEYNILYRKSSTQFDDIPTNKRVTVSDGSGIGSKWAIEIPAKLTVEYAPDVASGRFEKSLKFEDAVRPGWMSKDIWDNDHITEKVYMPLLGCHAITDDKSIGKSQQEKLFELRRQEQANAWKDNVMDVGPGQAPPEEERLGKKREPPKGTAVKGDKVTFTAVTIAGKPTEKSGNLSEAELNSPALAYEGEQQDPLGWASVESLGTGEDRFVVSEGSVEVVIDGIAMVYGLIRERGGNVHEFIRNFTNRPIANMVDVLGSQNLQFDTQGFVADPSTMIEGFHSRAFGNYNVDGKNPLAVLFPGVKDPAKVKRPGILGGKEEEIRAGLDPRGRAHARVNQYVKELKVSRGLLGS